MEDSRLFVSGVVTSPYDARDYKIAAQHEFPVEFSTNKVIVKDQGSQGTCVPHVLSSIIEYHNKRQQNSSKRFSTEFIYGCRYESGDYLGEGMIVRQALKVIQKYGDPYHTDFGGNSDCVTAMQRVSKDFDNLRQLAHPHRISAYMRLNSVDEMKTALMQYGPIVVTMTWHSHSTLIDNVYTYDENDEGGGHCVMVYGWNSKGWLVQNSWGSSWGDKGRFVIPFTFKFREAWGVVDKIVNDEDIIKPNLTGWMPIVYKIMNYVVNLWLKLMHKS